MYTTLIAFNATKNLEESEEVTSTDGQENTSKPIQQTKIPNIFYYVNLFLMQLREFPLF